ncbi:acetyl-CoA carboxylase biotin carboxylase subunit [Methylovirgula sp. HY1]|uniref:acetyl-CoA carboxylase biotin carboxylase subunit n=1 Tax=Methylovirgula sp. HY1 TaxID=2822761 RepID=UPI001C5B7669|nr:acetyl-CoA carboxylase biotin carboxylase subunit [Methylovirgula sp. HY1]QXX73800.1 Acetyl-/propionyl-coenzyme A carboxylase alpha chain [Methylovirgula sp. HY1]
MFKKILIANRGEIACRLIKSAHRMGIACVAVYSEADRKAPHVAMADEAICIGPAPAAQSYLAIDRIIAACHASGAEAVHPGYGFLSESAAFAREVEEAGLVFIGPNVRAIALMGDKIAAKQLAHDAGVSTLPGCLDVIEDAAQAADIAGEIGYPVMFKASAGGGGKGMRIAYEQSEVAAAFARARSEAASAFGDDRIFIEKFIEHPRHIEIQILGDKFGNIIHLGERECSIQRRHQKIVEEAPSPCVDDGLRFRMGEQAIALARAVAYDSAGTVEFILEQRGDASQFYFLEMNTRLQVEHPVTELVTGIDLVEAMIKIAAGERLAYAQSDVHLRGWAVESRICAEDPSRDFLPSAGRITRFHPPKEGHRDGVTLRHDTGVVEGSEISTHYDPMIGKLITHAGDRAAAVAAQADALDQFTLEGISHNIPFLAALMQNARFKAGALSTDFITSEYPHGFASRPPTGDEIDLLAAVAASFDHVLRARQMLMSGRIAPLHAVGSAAERSVMFGRMRIDVVIDEGDDGLLIRMVENGQARLCQSNWGAGMKVWTGTVDGTKIFVQVRPHRDHYVLSWRGISVEAAVYSRHAAEFIALMPEMKVIARSNDVRSPMPGLVKAILVQAGQAVKTGDGLCIIEAMKMEMMVRAEQDATIRTIDVAEGASLGLDALIMSLV